jgi:hypothetical protein
MQVKNYQEIYTRFLEYVTSKIDITRLNSVFIGGLMFTHDDYTKILKKEPYLDVLYRLEKHEDGFVRESIEVRDWFYTAF